MKRFSVLLTVALLCVPPGRAWAWGHEGHEIIALIARSYLTPSARAKVDALLSADTDLLTGHDMPAEATWADVYRGAGHRETASWHFIDVELDHPDLDAACFGHPSQGALASAGPAQDCVTDKVEAFAAELHSPTTSPAERLSALKFLLHFVGDLHQPLHASDNHDRGGNCVQVSLGGSRTTNLHSFWDTAVVEALGTDSGVVAGQLRAQISPSQLKAWQAGSARQWSQEAYGVARRVAYTAGSQPGCDTGAGPITLPPGYPEAAQAAAAVQLKAAGVRLAWLLNQVFGAGES